MYLPHKNHKCVIDTVKTLKLDYGINLFAVFCGSDKGYLKKIKKYANEQKQNEQNKQSLNLSCISLPGGNSAVITRSNSGKPEKIRSRIFISQPNKPR